MQQDAANKRQHQEIQESDVQKRTKNIQANQAKNAPELTPLSFALHCYFWLYSVRKSQFMHPAPGEDLWSWLQSWERCLRT